MLALKGNQGLLSQQVEDWFNQAIANNWQGIEYSYHSTVESGHHRIDTRSRMDCASQSITTVASPKSVARFDHCRDGEKSATIME